MTDLFDFYPYAERFGVNRATPRQRPPSRGDPRRAPRPWPARRIEVWEDGQLLRDDVLRRPRPLRLPEGGVRALRSPERPAARHVPERDALRGRDHRDGPRPLARRARSPTAPTRRAWSPRAAAAASCTPCSPYREHAAARTRGIDAPELRQARDRPPGVRQGVPSARRRAAPRAGRSRRRRRSDAEDAAELIDDQTIAHRRLGRATTATARSTRSRSWGSWPSIVASACTSTAAWAASSCPSASSSATPIPPFDFRVPGVTTLSADTHKYGYALEGHLHAPLPRPRRCATAATSSCRTGAVASTSPRGSTARARTGCWPPPGRRWSRWAARAIARYAKRDPRGIGGDAGGRSLPSRAEDAGPADVSASLSPPTSSTSTTSMTR